MLKIFSCSQYCLWTLYSLNYSNYLYFCIVKSFYFMAFIVSAYESIPYFKIKTSGSPIFFTNTYMIFNAFHVLLSLVLICKCLVCCFSIFYWIIFSSNWNITGFMFSYWSLSNFGPMTHYFSHLEWLCKSLLIILFFQILLASSLDILLDFDWELYEIYIQIWRNLILFFKIGSSFPQPVCPSIDLELL